MAQQTSFSATMGEFQTRGDDFLHLKNSQGSVVGGIDNTGTGFGTMQGGFVPPVTKVLYVDGGRTDSYTADGSLLKPFKTIMAAVNQIITNGDNSASVPYLIDIVGPGTYVENVDLSNAAIVNLGMEGHREVIIAPTSGDALASTSNNTGFATCYIQDIQFQLSASSGNALNFQCPTNGGGMGSSTLAFKNCFFAANGGGTSKSMLLNNIVNIEFRECSFAGSTQLTNVNLASVISNSGLSSSATPTTTLITNNGLPVPSGFVSTLLQAVHTQWAGNISIDAGSTFADQFCKDVARGGTITVNGSYLSEGSVVRGNITVNSGGNYTPRGTAGLFSGTLTINGGGSLTPTGTMVFGGIILGTAAPTAQAGQVGLGSGTAATATAGAATLPANPTGFLIVNIGGTVQKIPYYNN